MTHDEAFLRAICESPGDDGVRLVYADYLEDHGQAERAEFIRVQVELARLPLEDERVSALQAREIRLLGRHGERWFGGAEYAAVRRGFREEWLFKPPTLFPQAAERIPSRGPLREVVFGYSDDVGSGWGRPAAGAAHLASVEGIHFAAAHSRAVFEPGEVLAVLSSPHLSRLTTLSLCAMDLDDDTLFKLIRPGRRTHFLKAPVGPLPSLRNLRRLCLAVTGVTDGGLRALVESPLAGTLVALDLSRAWRVSDEGIRILIDSPLWERLEELNLAELDISEEAIGWLAAALGRSRIARLGLSGRPFSTSHPVEWVEALAAAPSWGRLAALDLSWRQLDGPCARMLAACPHLAGLRWLDLDSNDFGGDDLIPLLVSPHLRNLSILSAYGAGMNDAALEALAGSPHAPRLVYLGIDNSRVGDAGVAAFVKSPAAGRLRVWDLPPDSVGDKGMRAIADSPHLGRLTTLLFGAASGTGSTDGATDAGAFALVESANLPNLAHVEGPWGRISAAGARALLACDRFAWHGWPTHLFDDEALLQAYRDRFGDFDGRSMLPGDNLRMFPWARHDRA
jgi:uncharacterized protein (TIGR02996 family)